MAEKRSDRGDLKRELNSLWRSTLKQFDELKDVLVESSTAGKAKIDATLLKREREHKLAAIGEAVLALMEDGKIELPLELKGTVDRIREIESEIEAQETEFRRVFGRDRERAERQGAAGAAAEAEAPQAREEGDEAAGDEAEEGRPEA